MHSNIAQIAQTLVNHNCYSYYFTDEAAVLDVLRNWVKTANAANLADWFENTASNCNDVADAMYDLHGDVEHNDLSIYDTFKA